jgi:glyoxylase-like metal-dependent hydrolase (beta-lactamase superfamily II)
MAMTATDTIELVPNQGWDARVRVLRCGDLVDAFAVCGTRYVVLIDTLINPQTAAQMLQIVKPELVGDRQLLVVNTHADWDHCWGNQLFAGPDAVYPAPIIASRGCAERLRAPEAQVTLRRMQAEQPGVYDDVRPTPPTIVFDERLWIDAGDLTLELFPTPGHRPDHIAVYIPEIGTLLAGDAAEQPFPLVDTAGGLPLLRASLAHMDALRPTAALYCHAPVTSGPALLQDNIAYFDELERRCGGALSRGVQARPAEDADVAALVAFPVAAALPAGLDAETLPELYQRGHRTAIRAMLEYLDQQRPMD